jgi:hypothetical protein
MTAIKTFKRATPAQEMIDNRQAWLFSDNERFIVFRIYSRDGERTYMVTIRKSDLQTNCPCEDRTNNCWHMRKAMHSYLLRIQRGEVQ